MFFLSFLSTVPPSLLYFIPERPEWVYPNIQITLSHFIWPIIPYISVISRDFSCFLSFKHPFVDVRGNLMVKVCFEKDEEFLATDYGFRERLLSSMSQVPHLHSWQVVRIHWFTPQTRLPGHCMLRVWMAFSFLFSSHNMAFLRHFGSSDLGDQQVAHGNQNIHAVAQDKEMECEADVGQGQLTDFLSPEALNADHEDKVCRVAGPKWIKGKAGETKATLEEEGIRVILLTVPNSL